MKYSQNYKSEAMSVKITESYLELLAPCPDCQVYRHAMLHEDGIVTVKCGCNCTQHANVYIVDPESVRARIGYRQRREFVDRKYPSRHMY